MAAKPSLGNDGPLQQRDRWTAVCLLLFSWLLFGLVEQSPFALQGAVVENFVERGRLHFFHGNIKQNNNERVFENLDTNTPSFRYLFNIFPYGSVYHVNHAPGQFILAAPWYAVCVQLGWRFETHARLVWRVLVWTLTAPLGALGVMCLFLLARWWHVAWLEALFASVALALASPLWPASGVLYHDSLAVALVLIGGTLWLLRQTWHGIGAIVSPIAAGFLLAFAVVTTYLLAPIVLVICGFILAGRPLRRDALLFALGFVPSIAILPVTNFMAFGTPLATGYSAGGFEKNFPSIFAAANAIEKAGFYLWNFEYGLLWLFPIFLLGALGLTRRDTTNSSARRLLIALAAVHFIFIITMEHHGSAGWGMGRFFLPLYPILALGLPAFWHIEGWKGNLARVLLFAALFYSAVFAAAGAAYGLQGIMEPGVWSLKQRFIANHYQLYNGLFWIVLMGGILAEALNVVLSPRAPVVAHAAQRRSPEREARRNKVTPVADSRKRRRKK
jgi:hypothetical protein